MLLHWSLDDRWTDAFIPIQRISGCERRDVHDLRFNGRELIQARLIQEEPGGTGLFGSCPLDRYEIAALWLAR